MFGLFKKRAAVPAVEPVVTREQGPIGQKCVTYDLTAYGDDFADLTTAAALESAVKQGRVEEFWMIGEPFGGTADPANVLCGPPGVSAVKAAIDAELVAALDQGVEIDFSADCDYGDSSTRVPRRVVFDLGQMGTRTLRLW